MIFFVFPHSLVDMELEDRWTFPFEDNLSFERDVLFFGFLDALSGRGDETENEAPGESIARSLRGRPGFLVVGDKLSFARDALFPVFLDALSGRGDGTEAEAPEESIARSLRGRPGFLFVVEDNLSFARDAFFSVFLDALSGRGDGVGAEAPEESIARSLRGRPGFLFVTEVALASISELATRRFSPSVVNTELAGCFCSLLPFEGSRRIVGGESTSKLLRDRDALFFLLKGDFFS